MTQEQNTAAPASLEPDDACCARRSVLRGALALGAVGLVGGCGSKSSDTASSGAAPASAAPAASSPSLAAAGTSAAPSAAASTASASSSAGGSPSTLGPSSKVPVGGGMVYDTKKVVVTQPTAGTFKAFTAICTHEQCIVDDVDGGTINCACHGSKFSITDGSVVRGPATDPLAAKVVMVSGGNVVIDG